jgi:replication factor C subunit 2/4
MVILDEADSMTQDAQSALRRTMETYARVTRFCLVCNYVTRIIDPLASRCSKFRFKALDKGNAGRRLDDIARLEGVPLGEGAVEALVRCSDGDLRKAITFLQSAARLVGAVGAARNGDADGMDVDGGGDGVTVQIVEEIAGVVPESIVDRLFAAIKAKAGAGKYDTVASAVEDLVADGWSGTQVMAQLYGRVVEDEMVPDKEKAKVVMVFSEVDKRLVDGVDEQLAILDLSLRTSELLAAA